MQFLKKVQSDKGLNLKNIEMESFRTRIAYHLSHLRESLSDSLKSVRVWFFLLIVLMAWIPCTVMTAYVMDQMENEQIRRQVEELQYQGLALSRQMSRTAYLGNFDTPGMNIGMNAEISLLSDLYDGRIMVINDSFQVVQDTYNTDTNKYNISQKVLSCFRNGEKNNYEYFADRQYAEFTIPIYDQSLKQIRGVMVFSTSTRNIEVLFDAQRRQYQILELIICIVIAFLGFGLSGILMRPFNKLTNELNRANQGDMEPISVDDCMETARMSAVYNESLLRLKHLDESRQEFVSNVSHELKTPITSIRILADTLIAMGEAPVELYQEFMTDISEEIDRESRIIDDLLEMVRLDRNNAVLQVERVNINELLESVLKRLTGAADLRNISITLESIRSVSADVDELKFSRVISNLVENAIKYNKDGGSVNVSLNADQTYFYVKIVDTGVGIPEDEIGKIFERFYRVDKARSRETGGTGLGLSICKNIIQLHHGVIRVSSDYGEGSTFVVRIPLIYIP